MNNFDKSEWVGVGLSFAEIYAVLKDNPIKTLYYSNPYMPNIILYKNRSINYLRPVQVYKNLNKPGFYSIRQNGLVVAHSDYMEIKATKFVVNEISRQKVVMNKRKVVHAWAEGYLQKSELCTLGMKEIYYNPYTTDKFVYKDSGKEVEIVGNNHVLFGEKVYIAQ